MKQIGSRFHGEVHDSACSSPELGWIRIGLDLKLLDRIDGRLHYLGLIRIERCIIRVVVKSIEQVIVVGGALSASAEPSGPASDTVVRSGCGTALARGRQRALGKQRQLKVITAIQREFFHSALFDHRSLGRVRGPDQLRSGRNRHLLVQGA